MVQLDHERLDVYREALLFDAEVRSLLRSARARGDTVDQLKRASASVVLNIAEGAGEFAGREKARFYRMARRSATECAATLDLLVSQRTSSREELLAPRERLVRIISMLVRMIKNIDPSPTRRR